MLFTEVEDEKNGAVATETEAAARERLGAVSDG